MDERHDDLDAAEDLLRRALLDPAADRLYILATLVANPEALTEVERERWVLDITSWDLCDSAADLFGRAPAHADPIKAWARRQDTSCR